MEWKISIKDYFFLFILAEFSSWSDRKRPTDNIFIKTREKDRKIFLLPKEEKKKK